LRFQFSHLLDAAIDGEFDGVVPHALLYVFLDHRRLEGVDFLVAIVETVLRVLLAEHVCVLAESFLHLGLLRFVRVIAEVIRRSWSRRVVLGQGLPVEP